MRLRFGSVCSGIEAASVAWNPLGWEAAWLSEIEPFPCAVLAHHFPTIPNLGDMTTLPERIRAGEAFHPASSSGRTSPESSTPRTTPSAVSWENSLAQTLPFRHPQVDGRVQVWMPAPSERRRGECSMLNISECPNAAVVSSLWDVVLKKGSHSTLQRYFLSPRACRGLMKRAKDRGKTLPPTLREVLERTARSLPQDP